MNTASKIIKTLVIITVSVVLILLVVVRVFNTYRENGILSNEAVFKIYLDQSKIGEIFSLDQVQLNELKQYSVICKLPINKEHTFSQYVGVEKKENIDCGEKYESGRYTKYTSYQLKSSRHFELLLINGSSSFFDERFNQSKVISKLPFSFKYRKGEINRIVVEKNNIYDYCDKKE